VKEADTPGFVRISSKDRRYFAFENGQPYFPVGANVCWAYGQGTFDYDEWFPKYAAAGCNYAASGFRPTGRPSRSNNPASRRMEKGWASSTSRRRGASTMS